MGLAVVMVVLEEEVLVAAVAGKGNGRDAQAGEGVLEAVPAGEGASVSPGLISLPGIVSGSAGGLLEGPHVEAGDVGLGPAGGRS